MQSDYYFELLAIGSSVVRLCSKDNEFKSSQSEDTVLLLKYIILLNTSINQRITFRSCSTVKLLFENKLLRTTLERCSIEKYRR